MDNVKVEFIGNSIDPVVTFNPIIYSWLEEDELIRQIEDLTSKYLFEPMGEELRVAMEKDIRRSLSILRHKLNE